MHISDINKIHVIGDDALDVGQKRLQVLVESGRSKAARVHSLLERLSPKDYLVRLCTSEYSVDKGTLRVQFFVNGTERINRGIHVFALSQLVTLVDMPPSWAKKLLEKRRGEDCYGADILAHDLNELLMYDEGRYLLRVVNDEVRGVLSTRYKRLDSKPLVDAFASACMSVGAVPCGGALTATKVIVHAILPKIQQPLPGEFVVYGVTFTNSDFGDGAMDVQMYLMRVHGGTGMVGQSGLRKVHRGKTLEDAVNWSEETREADVRLAQSQVRDLVTSFLSQEKIDEAQGVIRKAYQAALGDDDVVTSYLKKFLNKTEIEELLAKYNQADAVELPPGNNMWRLANAVAWLANSKESVDETRAEALRAVSGQLLQET